MELKINHLKLFQLILVYGFENGVFSGKIYQIKNFSQVDELRALTKMKAYNFIVHKEIETELVEFSLLNSIPGTERFNVVIHNVRKNQVKFKLIKNDF